MKTIRLLSFRFILISAVTFCYGINMYSGDFSNKYCVEFFNENSKGRDCLVSHIDTLIDDQIPQNDQYRLFSDAKMSMPVVRDTFILPESCLRIWQPPKI
jgi:hypothetical protein